MPAEITDFLKCKARRAYAYFTYEYGWKLRPCTACNGSGYYDDNGSPTCGGCDGSKVERYKGPKSTSDAFEINNPYLYNILKSLN